MSLGKTIKRLVAEVKQKTNYGGVQEMPMYGIGYDQRMPRYGIGYDQRMQYAEGGQNMYAKKKMMGGGSTKRSTYKNGGTHIVCVTDCFCNSSFSKCDLNFLRIDFWVKMATSLIRVQVNQQPLRFKRRINNGYISKFSKRTLTRDE